MPNPIAHKISALQNQLPAEVTLVAVSKTKPIEVLQMAYDGGQRVFGENKIQEMAHKWAELPKDIQWHMIGHVQTNKVKYMAPFVSLVHSVDSLKLLKEIDKQGRNNNRCIPCLLQIKIASEAQKFGLTQEQAIDALHSEAVKQMEGAIIIGLMGMATFTDDPAQIAQEFALLHSFYDQNKTEFGFTTLSIGMSADYDIALQYGSNMIRVGSALFGEREAPLQTPQS